MHAVCAVFVHNLWEERGNCLSFNISINNSMPSGISSSIRWSMLELRGLVEDEDARVYFQRAKRHLGLHPFHLNDLNRALREIFSSSVNFYDNELQGLVLAYKNPKLLGPLGAILHDSHFIHVDVLADFYLFKPEIGCTLKGIINKKAANHVGVLVHKAFNVSIPKPDESEEWLGEYVFVGQEVKFTVTHLDFKGKLPFVRGKLIVDGIAIPNHDDRVAFTNGEEDDKKLGPWEDTGTVKLGSETTKKRSKKYKAVDSSGDDLSDSDNKRKVFRGKEEKSTRVKKRLGTAARIDDESHTDRSEEHVLNNGSMENQEASSNKRNRKKQRDSSPKKLDTGDVDEKPKISPRKGSKQQRANGESDIMGDNTILKTEAEGSSRKRSDKNTIPAASNEKEVCSFERRTGMIESLKVEKSSEDKKGESASKSNRSKNGVQHDTTVDAKFAVDSDENREEKVTSPKKRSKKNPIFVSEGEESSEIETKPGIRVKRKKKKIKNDTEAEKCNVEKESKPLPSYDSSFEFVKPDADACGIPSVKCKRKRRKDIDGNIEEASDSSQPDLAENNQSESDFFRDIRIKVEPDPSDVEDTVSRKKSVKRKKKHAKTEFESEDESFVGDTRIKTEPDISDLELAMPSKKKSKRRRTSDKDAFNDIKIKVEPNASDVEGSVIPRERFKSEPHDSKVKVDRERGRV